MKTLTIKQFPAFLRHEHEWARFHAFMEEEITGQDWYTTYIHAMWQSIWPALKCWWLRSHDLFAHDGDAENGSEELTCKRCGWSQTIYW